MDFVVAALEKLTFPVKVWLELTNASGIDVVLHSAFFKFAANVKPHPRLRCSAGARKGSYCFRGGIEYIPRLSSY